MALEFSGKLLSAGQATGVPDARERYEAPGARIRQGVPW